MLAVLRDLLSDLHRPVAIGAAAALARHRHRDGVGLLLHAVERDSIDADSVDAIATLAENDRDFAVLLRRLARRGDAVGNAARKALEADDGDELPRRGPENATSP